MKNSMYKALLDDTLAYFKQHMSEPRTAFASKKKAATLFCEIFRERIHDYDFQVWFTKEMALPGRDCLLQLIEYANAEDPVYKPRNMGTEEERQQAYDYWRLNSTVSVYRSNDRNIVKISSANIASQAKDLKDEDIKPISDKEDKFSAHKKVISSTYRELHSSYQHTYGSSMSFSAFLAVKPFYIYTPTEKEAEMCMCSNCLNPHSFYKAIKHALADFISFPHSLSAYLGKEVICQRDAKTDFFKLDCILGKCTNKCQVTNIIHDINDHLATAETKNASYYVFEKIPTHYYNKDGKKVTYDRVGRVDKNESVLRIISELQKHASDYLIHRFFAIHDRVHWEKFLDNTPYHALWLDFSQNIKLVEKNQAQSAHFSGKQQTLHNTVLCYPNRSDTRYVYHLSDDTTHDSVMTFNVINDIIKQHPEVISKGVLVLRSDNCQAQYKCKYTFAKMKQVAQRHGITVAWFYCEPGHGKGIVDAMSAFGAKGPLRNEITRTDAWFPDAQTMTDYLKNHFKDDVQKEHHFISEIETATERKKKQAEFEIRPCRKFHLIAMSKDGQVHRQLYFENPDLANLFNKPEEPWEEFEYNNEALDDATVLQQNFCLDTDTVFDLVWTGTFIALKSAKKAIEPFVLCRVLNKGIAASELKDGHGHLIYAGSKYAEVEYLTKECQRGKKVKYSKSKQAPVLIYINEVAVTNIDMDPNLNMCMSEYIYVSEAVL